MGERKTKIKHNLVTRGVTLGIKRTFTQGHFSYNNFSIYNKAKEMKVRHNINWKDLS